MSVSCSSVERHPRRVNLLHDMLQRMRLRLLEVVASVDRIEPRVQEVLGPLSIPNNEAVLRQSIFVLSNNKIYPISFEVSERFDDTVWWYYRLMDDHEFFELRGREDVRCESY